MMTSTRRRFDVIFTLLLRHVPVGSYLITYPVIYLPNAIVRVVITIDIAAESLPGEPAHGRCARQAIVQRQHWRRQAYS